MPVDATKEARDHDLWSNHSPFDQKILELFLLKRLKESFGEEHDGGDALLTVAAWNKADLATAVDDNSPSRDIRSAPGFKM